MMIDRCEGVYEPEDDSYLLMGIGEIEGKLLEIGSGTGIVGLSYAQSGVKVTMVDVTEKAVRCSRRNATRNRITVNIIRTNMFEGIRGEFDFCVFNPPYLPAGPANHTAWTGGPTGNETTLRFLRSFRSVAKVAFYIESSLSSIPKEMFKGLEFKTLKKLNYDFEDISLVKVSDNAFHR